MAYTRYSIYAVAHKNLGGAYLQSAVVVFCHNARKNVNHNGHMTGHLNTFQRGGLIRFTVPSAYGLVKTALGFG